MKNLNDVVVERLCKFMGEKDLTQYKLAQLSGLPFPTLKSIMQRRTKGITLKTIILLSNGLGITPSEFINDKAFSAENLELE
ncbi:MAG: helix-turn-helix transcriptional regulator [Clostridia bacterium]|nr:helix-turn-helix transcriptional regulator [Clostridia bacterium]